MSFEEQQRDELEALAAIYANEYECINDINDIRAQDDKRRPKFSISIISEEQEDDTELDIYQLTLQFTFPKNYPDVGPEIEITSSDNLEDRDELEILDELEDMVPENLGIAMVFTLMSKTQEWLNVLKDRKKLERKEDAQRRQREIEELEHRKFEGTRVTVESFISWKLKFDAEMALRNKQVKVVDPTKLTGKEMFLQDKNLINSDLSFAIDGNDEGDDVKVDESLFANEDLDDDDPDYDPEEDN